MAAPAAVLQILVTANSAQAVTGLRAVDAQAKKTAASTTASTSRISSGFSQMASVAKTALVAGVAYGLYSGVKAGIEFEKQMDAVGAVTDASAKKMKKLEDQALRLGQKTAFSATEAAKAQEELAKGGLATSDILGGALKSSLNLAAAGQLDLAVAAETTVNAMKLFELQGKDAGKVADMFATAANRTTADVEDFAMALKQGGSAAKAAGYDLNQTMVVLEALAEAGIKNSDAGTSMKAAFLQLLAPTEKQAALAKQLNIDWVNQNGNLKSAVGISKELRDALGGMTNAQQAANLKVLAGTDGFRTLNALMDEGPAKLRELAKANREQGTAQEVADKKMDNTAGSIEQLKGAWETLSISLFKQAQSPFRSIIDSMTEAVQDLTDVVTDKSLTSDEKISKVMEMVTSAIADAVPKVLGVGVQIGTALMKGIANAFIHGSILTKLFIGAGAIRLFGGAGVFGRIGGTIASKIMGGLSGKLGGLGGTIAGGLTARGTSPLNPVFVKDVGGGVGGGPVGGGGRGGGVRPFLPGIGGATIALTAGAFRKQIIDALFPDGWANDALHNAFDSSSITTSGGTGGFFGDDIVEQITKTWDGIFGDSKIMGEFGRLRSAMLEVSKVTQQMGRGLRITRSDFKFASQGATSFGDSLLTGIDSVKRWAQAIRRNNDDVGKSLSGVGRAFKGLAGDTDKNLDRSRGDVQKFQGVVKTAQGKVGGDLKDMGQDVTKFAGVTDKQTDKVGDSFSKTTGRSGKMARGVGQNITALANGVATGLDVLRDNLNKSLAAFKVKKVGYSIKKVGNTVGDVVGAQKGAIVPGSGSGDKVPLHIDGRLSAMVEPGELVSVANRTATERLMAVNKAVPRRKDGGIVGLARGGTVPGDTGGLHQGILDLVNSLYQRFGGSVSSGLRSTDAGSLHSTGQAADYVPGNWAGAAAAANRVGSSLLEGIYNPGTFGGPAVSWDSGQQVSPGFWGGSTWAGHLDHIHLAVADGTKAIAGAAVEQLKRILLKGPKGPLREMGQGALDMAWKAANAYLRDAMPRVGAEPVSIESGGAVVAQMGRYLLANNFSRAGAAGIIGNAYRESLWDPSAVGTGGGGLFGFTTSPVSLADLQRYADKRGRPWTDVETQMAFMLGSPGGGGLMTDDYYNGLEAFLKSTNDIHDATYRFMNEWERPGIPAFEDRLAGAQKAYGMKSWKHGGIVAKLAKGGLVGDLKKVLDVTRESDNEKRKRRVLKDFLDQVKDIGLNENLRAALTDLDAEQTKYGEYADNAASLAEDGIDRFKGKTESEWLEQQLGTLFKLRNRLIRAHKAIRRRQREIIKLLKFAEDQQKKIKKAVRVADKEKRQLERQITKEKKEKNPNRELIKGLEDKVGSIDERQKMRNAALGVLKGKVIPGIKGKKGNLSELYATNLERLDAVQGTGMRKEYLKTAPYGKLGGEILTVQQRIREVGGNTTARDEDRLGILEDMLRTTQQQLLVSQRQYGVFAGTPILGAFEKGGVAIQTGSYLVGERGPEVVHLRGGDTVSPNSALGGDVNVAVTLYEGSKTALIDVNGKEFEAAVQRVNRRQARSGGRVLPGRAGS